MAKKGGNAAGVRTAPHPMLLALVAQFLENNGFNSSHRIYNTERRKRPKKEGWQGTFAKDYTAKFPPLESIFNIWQQEHGKEDTSSDSESDVDSSASEDDPTSVPGSSPSKNKQQDDSASSSQSASEHSSGSESSDNEEKDEGTSLQVQSVVATTTGPARILKRKAPESSSDSDSTDSDDSSSESSEESESDEDVPPVKKQRVGSPSSSASDSEGDSASDSNSESSSEPEVDTGSETKAFQEATEAKLPSTSSEESSYDSSSSDDASDRDVTIVPRVLKKAGSDSSGTIVGDVKATQTSSGTSSNEDTSTTAKVIAAKKKHIGAQPTRLAQLSAASDMSNYVSNNYVSYDYADKAYRDLVVTRGKGFTKEKNKKKRGSYRGGAIDIGGGKGFKFDD